MRNGLKFVVAASLTTVLAGCGGRELPEDETFGTVKGTIKHNGQAVAEGTQVVFKNVKKGWMATASVKTDGAFSLRFRDGTDIPTGLYAIGITPPSVGNEVDPDSQPDEYGEMMGFNASTGKASKTDDKAEEFQFPARFANPDTSAEEFTVKEGENEYNLDMKDA